MEENKMSRILFSFALMFRSYLQLSRLFHRSRVFFFFCIEIIESIRRGWFHFSSGIWKFIVIEIINCIILYNELRSVSNNFSLFFFICIFFFSLRISIADLSQSLSYHYTGHIDSLNPILVPHAMRMSRLHLKRGGLA